MAPRVRHAGPVAARPRDAPRDDRDRGRPRALHGVPDTANFVVGRVLSAEQHPDADRLKVCTGRCGRGRAAADRLRRAERRRGPDGGRRAARRRHARRHEARQGQAARRRLPRDDPRRGRGLGRHGPRGDDGARRRLVPGTPLSDALAIHDDVLELEITPNRPDCLGVYGVAREVHAVTGAPLGPPPWARDPAPAPATRRRHRRHGAGPGPVPAVHRAACSRTSRSARRRCG